MDNEHKKNTVTPQVGRPKKKTLPPYIEREYIRPTQRISAARQKKSRFPEGIQRLPGKHYCWVLEQDIQQRINAYYDFVIDENGERVREVANKSVDMTAMNRMQFLMMVDEKYHLEDLEEEGKKIISLKIKKNTLQAGQYLPRSA